MHVERENLDAELDASKTEGGDSRYFLHGIAHQPRFQQSNNLINISLVVWRNVCTQEMGNQN